MRRAVVILTASFAACLSPVDLGAQGYACSADADCAGSLPCVDGICGGRPVEEVPSCVPAQATCPPGALGCVDFEADAGASEGWTVLVTDFAGSPADGGVVQVVPGPGCNGSAVLKTHMERGELRAMFERDIADAGATAVWIRSWVYLPASVLPLTDVSLVQAYVGAAQNRIMVDRDAVQFSTGSSLEPKVTGGRVPRDEWFCLELYLRASDDPGRGYLAGFANGALQAGQAQRTTEIPGEVVRSARIGVAGNAQQSEPFTAYFDNVVIAQTRPGCE